MDAMQLAVREEVATFALSMEEKLRLNDHKGGWSECSLLWLVAKLNEELGELSQLIHNAHWSDGLLAGLAPDVVRQIGNEAADVGNLAMMIADQARRLAEWGTAANRAERRGYPLLEESMTEIRTPYVTAPTGDRALVEAVATRLMGWHSTSPERLAADEWHDAQGRYVAGPFWDPLTDPVAGAQVLDEIERRGWDWIVEYAERFSTPYVASITVAGGRVFSAEADTRYRAIALAALRASGVEV